MRVFHNPGHHLSFTTSITISIHNSTHYIESLHLAKIFTAGSGWYYLRLKYSVNIMRSELRFSIAAWGVAMQRNGTETHFVELKFGFLRQSASATTFHNSLLQHRNKNENVDSLIRLIKVCLKWILLSASLIQRWCDMPFSCWKVVSAYWGDTFIHFSIWIRWVICCFMK